jgi:hypothetical protein
MTRLFLRSVPRLCSVFRCLGPTQRRDPVSSSIGDSIFTARSVQGPLRHLVITLGKNGQGDRQRPALFDALSLGHVFVDRAIWSECVEHEGKRDVVGDIDKLISQSLLYDDVADVTARGDR